MAISYQSGFNSGELSPKLKGRSELDVYGNGCSRLENFLVLPQGGVERRPGTTYVGKTSDLTFDAWANDVAYDAGNKVYDSVTDANYIADTSHDPSYAPTWDDANSYNAGDFVTNTGKYVCNVDHVVSTLWTAGEDYAVNDLVIDSGTTYVCDIAQNLTAWGNGVTYSAGDLVTYLGSAFVARADHLAVAGGNDPVAGIGTFWDAYTTINQSGTGYDLSAYFIAYTSINQSGTNYDLSGYWSEYDDFVDAVGLYWSLYAPPAAGTEKCRFIPFVFSSTDNYAVEIGNGYAKVWNADGTYTNVSGVVPYSETDVAEIDYYQRFDILYLTHPDHPIQELRRTSRDPLFTIIEAEFDYPPMFDENTDGTTLTPAPKYDVWIASTVYSKGDIVSYEGSDYIAKQITSGGADFTVEVSAGEWRVENESSIWTITADSEIFDSDDWEGAYLSLRHDIALDEESSATNWEGVLTTGQTKSIDIVNSSITVSWTNVRSGSGFAGGISDGTQSDFAALFVDGGAITYGKEWTWTGGVGSNVTIVAGTSDNGRGKIGASALGGVAGNFTTPYDISKVSEALNVSFTNWTVQTGGNWLGRVVIERKTDGTEWREYIVLGDSRGGTEENFSYSSPLPEGKNTYIRLRSLPSSGPMSYSLQSDGGQFTSVCRVIERTSTTAVDVSIISPFTKTSPTFNWSMGAFSAINGYPRSISFHEDRMWLVGSDLEPATIYASTLGDYYNFLPGVEDDSSIRRIPTSAEQAEWLIGKRYLFAGTEGGTLLISSSNRDDITTPANIKTEYQSVFGSSSVTPVLANDVVVYAQKNGLKLREMIYSYEEENFRSNDLNILSDAILDPGVIEMSIQKQPDQTIWAVKSDGTVALLAYERGQEIVGWSRWETDGEVISLCVLPKSGEDDAVWMIVKRNGEYLVEIANPRSATGKFVDSSVTVNSAEVGVNATFEFEQRWQEGTAYVIGDISWYDGSSYVCSSNHTSADGNEPDVSADWSLDATTHARIKVTDVGHGLTAGDYVKFSNVTGVQYFSGRSFRIDDIDADSFYLMSSATDYLQWDGLLFALDMDIVGTSGASLTATQFFDADGNIRWSFRSASDSAGVRGYYVKPDDFDNITEWQIYYTPGAFPGSTQTTIATVASTELHPPKTGWTFLTNSPEGADPYIDWGDGIALEWSAYIGDDGAPPATTADYDQAWNTVSGLDHLDGLSVQVLGNGEYLGDKIVAGGSITADGYYSMLTAGLGYESIMRTMPVEPPLGNRLPNSRVKNVNQVIVKFFETIGAKVGTIDKTLTSLPSKRTYDETNEAIDVFSGDVDFNIPGDWRREKIVEVKQDAPYPMTILSLSAWTEVKGG